MTITDIKQDAARTVVEAFKAGEFRGYEKARKEFRGCYMMNCGYAAEHGNYCRRHKYKGRGDD